MDKMIYCNVCFKPGVSSKYCCGNNKEVRIQQINKEISNLTTKLVSYQNELIQLLTEDNAKYKNEKNIEP